MYNEEISRITEAPMHNIDVNTCVHILHNCAERLGLVSVKTFCAIHGKKRRAVYYSIQNGKLKSLKLDNNIYIIINDS